MLRELKFLLSLWKTNLAAVMEYRAAFISQSIGMILNDAVYFAVWVIFFNRFPSIRGWQLADTFLVFGVSASAFGLAGMLFGNAFNLGDIIIKFHNNGMAEAAARTNNSGRNRTFRPRNNTDMFNHRATRILECRCLLIVYGIVGSINCGFLLPVSRLKGAASHWSRCSC